MRENCVVIFSLFLSQIVISCGVLVICKSYCERIASRNHGRQAV